MAPIHLPIGTTDREAIQSLCQSSLRTLGMCNLDELRKMVEEAEEQINRHDSFAPVLDPENYFRAQRTGERQDAEFQAKMLRHLMEALTVLHERETWIAGRR